MDYTGACCKIIYEYCYNDYKVTILSWMYVRLKIAAENLVVLFLEILFWAIEVLYNSLHKKSILLANEDDRCLYVLFCSNFKSPFYGLPM